MDEVVIFELNAPGTSSVSTACLMMADATDATVIKLTVHADNDADAKEIAATACDRYLKFVLS